MLEEQEACVEWYWWGGYVASPFDPLPSQGGGAGAPRLGGRPVCMSILQGTMSHPVLPVLSSGRGWGPRTQTFLCVGAPHNPVGCGMRGWDWKSPDLHGDEPGAVWEGRFWVTNATVCCLPGVKGTALCPSLVSSPGPSTMPLGAPLPSPQLPAPRTQPPASLS